MRVYLWLAISSSLLALGLLASGPADSDQSEFELLGLTGHEISWLANHPVIRLAPDPDFPPIEFIDREGNYSGIAADFIRLLEKKLPLRFEIVELESWSAVLEQGRARKIDMFGAAAPTPERLEYMRFTRPYVEFPAVVLVRDSADSFPVLSELKGKRVAVVANYADHEYMTKAYPQIPLEVMPDISSGLRQVSFGKVDAMVLNLASASYYIQKNGITNLKVTEDADFVFDLSFAARRDWPELTSILEKTMASVSPAERKKIMDNWVSLGKKQLQLSTRSLALIGAGLLCCCLVAILSWNRVLAKRVRRRTADLQVELDERLRVEKEKNGLQQEVERAKKIEALGLLAGGVAHDLNNILAGVVGYSDLLLDQLAGNSDLRSSAKEIRNSGRRAAAVVADLLTISRDAASGRSIANLNTIIREYLSSPEHQVMSRRFPEIVFNKALAPNLSNFNCSEVHIKKTIMNLLINAAEATGSGRVTLSTVNIDPATQPATDTDALETIICSNGSHGPQILLSVQDAGSGIAREDMDHIFQPFYSRKKFGHSGTGLGLAVVWNTVEEHQGYIEVKQLEEGTAFNLYFPATEMACSTPVKSSPAINTPPESKHILVVDDEQHVRELAEKMLTHLGYRVSSVSSGEEAVVFLQTNRTELLFLDMLMEPGMNGHQTYAAVKAFRPDQRALISSGFSENREVQQTKDLGAAGYLKKPYTLQELRAAVHNALKS